jgi:hypothetical protein
MDYILYVYSYCPNLSIPLCFGRGPLIPRTRTANRSICVRQDRIIIIIHPCPTLLDLFYGRSGYEYTTNPDSLAFNGILHHSIPTYIYDLWQ